MIALKMSNQDKVILHLCADIGSDSQPYRDAGYKVICVGKDVGVENYTPPQGVYGVIANPPCTMFSIARTTAKTPRDMRQGMEAVRHCLRIIWECMFNQYVGESSRAMPLKFWAIENPGSGYLRWYLGQPRFEYCQSEFGAPFTKRTALWGQFNTPQRPFFHPDMQRDGIGRIGMKNAIKQRSLARGDGGGRAICPPKFAKAFFEVNP